MNTMTLMSMVSAAVAGSIFGYHRLTAEPVVPAEPVSIVKADPVVVPSDVQVGTTVLKTETTHLDLREAGQRFHSLNRQIATAPRAPRDRTELDKPKRQRAQSQKRNSRSNSGYQQGTRQRSRSNSGYYEKRTIRERSRFARDQRRDEFKRRNDQRTFGRNSRITPRWRNPIHGKSLFEKTRRYKQFGSTTERSKRQTNRRLGR